MPTVLSVDGFAVRVYPNDHGPPHVHVWKAGAWISLTLPSEERTATVLRVSEMKDADMGRAVRIVEENATALWAAWRQYHGEEAQ